MRMSIARFGSTKRNIYFASGKMQTDPDSPPTEITTQRVVFFIGIGIQKEGFEGSNAIGNTEFPFPIALFLPECYNV